MTVITFENTSKQFLLLISPELAIYIYIFSSIGKLHYLIVIMLISPS